MNRAMFEAALAPETVRQFLNHAISLGFICDRTSQADGSDPTGGTWQITPARGEGHWLLQLHHDRWLLVTQGIPQIRFSHPEALVFLERLSRDQLRSQVKPAQTRRAKATV